MTGGIAMGAAMLAAGPLYATLRWRGYWAMALHRRRRACGERTAALERSVGAASRLSPKAEATAGARQRALVAQRRLAIARQQQRAIEVDPVGALRQQHAPAPWRARSPPCSRP